jgi:transposase
LIVDNAKTPHGKILTEWAEENEKRVVLFYLPPYSPDLNPGGHIKADVKYGADSGAPKRTKEGLGEVTEEHMNMLRETPERIRRYFLDPAIVYTADV